MQVSRITMFIDKNVTKTISVLESSLSENILPENLTKVSEKTNASFKNNYVHRQERYCNNKCFGKFSFGKHTARNEKL